MKRLPFYISICLGLTIGLSACSDKDNVLNTDSESQKQPILFSSSINYQPTEAPLSRADAPDTTAFAKPTGIKLRLMSESNESGTTTKYETLDAKIESADIATDLASAITLSSKKYWDDMHGVNAHLSAYAMGIYGYTGDGTDLTNGNELAFSEQTSNNKLTWKVSTTQTSGTYTKEDLILSNNIQQSDDTDASTDKRIGYLGFGKGFQTGNMVFTHALSKITINVKISNEFTETEKRGIAVTLNNFATAGTVDVTTGTFADASKADITPIELETPAEGYNNTYEALVIPSRNWDAEEENVATITMPGNSTLGSSIIANTFFMKNTAFNSKTLLESKLTGNIVAGNHYIFNLNIHKTGLILTANIKKWVEETPINITPLLVGQGQIGTQGSGKTMGFFDLYISQKAGSEYSKISTCTWDTKENVFSYSPKPRWPDHDNAYFFRAVGQLDDKGDAIIDTERPTPLLTDNKQINISTCQNTSIGNVKAGTDICVGAPYESDGSLTPGKKAGEGVGGDGESSIHLIFKHVLSEVYVHLTTTNDEESKVVLEGAKVEILNSYTSGTVMTENIQFSTLSGSRTDSYSLGNACKNLKKLPGDTDEKADDYSYVYRCYAIPQNLDYANGTDESGNPITGYIQFRVTTADGNSYFVDAERELTGGSILNKWKGGQQYLYNLTIHKTGIVLTAQILDWADPVIANYDDVQIQ